jgi:cyclase
MRKAIAVRLGGATLAAAGLWVAWSQAQRPPLTIEKLSDNLYVIVGNGGNVAVMPTSEGVILVDDKFAQDAPEIAAKVKSVSDKPVRYVLNTHQHPDHTGGNEVLLAASAEIIAHRNARANMLANKQPGLPRVTFSDETQVFLGGKEVNARYLGNGHTNGDAVVLFPAERTIHTGDLFVNGGAPFIDYASGGSLADWDRTLERILALDFDTVIPGHGPVAKKADLAKWRASLATLRSRAAEACKAGAQDAGKRIKIDDLGMKPGPLFDRSVPGMCKELGG